MREEWPEHCPHKPPHSATDANEACVNLGVVGNDNGPAGDGGQTTSVRQNTPDQTFDQVDEKANDVDGDTFPKKTYAEC